MSKSHPKLDPAELMKVAAILPDPSNERETILWDNVDDLATRFQAKLHASEPACPPKAKRLTLEIGNEKLEEVCVTRISPGKDYAGFIAEKSGDLYAVNFTAARGSVTINETRTVKAIVDAKGRRWPGKWKFVRSPQGRYAMVREP